MNFDNTIFLKAIPALIILIIVETIYLVRTNEHKSKNLLTDLFLGLTAIPVSFLLKGVILYTYTIIYEFRLITIPSGSWYIWPLCFFADDFSYYWYHRMSHQVRFLWASHMVHHSSEQFTFSTGLRVPWTGNLSGNFLFWAWMPFIGIEPAMVLFFKTASVGYQFLMHTETIGKLPKWIENIFNTPSHHRVHHASDIEYLDKNHGGTLIIWDRIFGTFHEENHKPKYGLSENIHSHNPIKIELHEWKNLFNDLKKAKNMKEKFHYIFDSPGWSNDGKTKTTYELQSAHKLPVQSRE